MKLFIYIRYFFFIAVNWNLRLAIFTLSHEIRGEKKYALNTVELNDLKKATLQGELNTAEIYQPAGYYILEYLFSKIDEFVTEKNMVDFGCGKGRAMAVAAYYHFKTITGIEFAKELAMQAAINLSIVALKTPAVEFKVEWIDAKAYKILQHQNVCYFFNPFKEAVMKNVIENILLSKQEFDRSIYIIYVNPVYKDLFIEAGFREKYYHKKMEYVEGIILELL
ncbi:MAG: hypothetical protein ABIR81_00955 [Ginsengibacter sp.]